MDSAGEDDQRLAKKMMLGGWRRRCWSCRAELKVERQLDAVGDEGEEDDR